MGTALPEGADESGFDLFDRWLAHRDQQAAPSESPLFTGTSVDLGVAAEELLAATPSEPSTSAPPTGVGAPVERPEHEAARAVIAALAADRPSPVTAPDPGAHTGVAERGAAAVSWTARPKAVTADPLPGVAASTTAGPATAAAPSHPVLEFGRRRGARRVAGLLLLASLAATAASAYVAHQDGSTPSIGIAGALAVLTAVIWAVRAGTQETSVTVRGGEVEIVRGGSRHRFDLAGHYTPVDVVGEPGSRTWKVLFHRRGLAPYVVDASMVDPVEFTRVVRHYRPTSG